MATATRSSTQDRVLGLLVASLLLVCAVAAGCAQKSPAAPSTAKPEVWTEPGPFTLPADQLVVPYDLIPVVGDSEKAVTKAVRDAFGPLLASVSVKATELGTYDDDGGAQTGYRIDYRLVDCLTPATMFVADLEDCGFIPPITQMYETPPGRDWMSKERFRELLNAWAGVSDKPFGGLTSYATAVGRYGSSPRDTDTVTLFGEPVRMVGELWVVTEGASTRKQFLTQQYDAYQVPGYVFSFPHGGKPEYLGVLADAGWQEGLGD